MKLFEIFSNSNLLKNNIDILYQDFLENNKKLEIAKNFTLNSFNIINGDTNIVEFKILLCNCPIKVYIKYFNDHYCYANVEMEYLTDKTLNNNYLINLEYVIYSLIIAIPVKDLDKK